MSMGGSVRTASVGGLGILWLRWHAGAHLLGAMEARHAQRWGRGRRREKAE